MATRSETRRLSADAAVFYAALAGMGFLFIVVHEAVHWVVAAVLGLSPVLEWGWPYAAVHVESGPRWAGLAVRFAPDVVQLPVAWWVTRAGFRWWGDRVPGLAWWLLAAAVFLSVNSLAGHTVLAP